jgi:nucleotide-binding universal stress UspA family protein
VIDREIAPTHRIIVGIDGSDQSMKALIWAAGQAALTNSTLEVVTTWEWPSSYGWALPLPPEYSPKSEAEKLLDDAVAQLGETHPDLDVRTAVKEGRPAPILTEASRTADLLVVGSRGHGEFTGMLLGSVSEHCVTNAHCPVVVIRDRS